MNSIMIFLYQRVRDYRGGSDYGGDSSVISKETFLAYVVGLFIVYVIAMISSNAENRKKERAEAEKLAQQKRKQWEEKTLTPSQVYFRKPIGEREEYLKQLENKRRQKEEKERQEEEAERKRYAEELEKKAAERRREKAKLERFKEDRERFKEDREMFINDIYVWYKEYRFCETFEMVLYDYLEDDDYLLEHIEFLGEMIKNMKRECHYNESEKNERILQVLKETRKVFKKYEKGKITNYKEKFLPQKIREKEDEEIRERIKFYYNSFKDCSTIGCILKPHYENHNQYLLEFSSELSTVLWRLKVSDRYYKNEKRAKILYTLKAGYKVLYKYGSGGKRPNYDLPFSPNPL